MLRRRVVRIGIATLDQFGVRVSHVLALARALPLIFAPVDIDAGW
jgi:hypothetical protein